MLSAAHYENELAFIVAGQLDLLRDRTTVRNLAALEGQEVGARLITLPTAPPTRQVDYLERDWFEPGGLFDFGVNPYLKADTNAVRLIYAAKFDPRGAATFIERWSQSPSARKAIGKILPDPQERLRTVRDEVAKLSPLRDPIVRTRAFDDLRTHLKKAATEKSARK
jgi:hypothetical protein